MAFRRLVTFGSVLVVLVVGAGVYYVAQGPCMDVLPVHETQALVRGESVEFERAAMELYEQDRGATGQIAGPLARPVRVVAISGKTATLALDKAMYAGNRLYAGAWRDIYRAHHGGGPETCVTVKLIWDSKSMVQQCCRADV